MDREGAETHLRVLGETTMRGALEPAPERPPTAADGDWTTMVVVAQALTAVGALDPETAEDILTDFKLAVSVRQLRGRAGRGPGWPAAAARWAAPGRYDLDCAPGGDPEWTSEISLHPTPPRDIRWLDVAAPNRPAADDEPQVSDVKLSPGEHLLVMLAERLLAAAPEFTSSRWRALKGPLRTMTDSLGDIIAALVAADALAPLSPVPARLAALCASLDIDGPQIAAEPAPHLPEPWLSLLAHYRRRKPDLTPVREGYAALAAALPELDGIRLVLLGLQHAEGTSTLHALARGRMREHHPGPLDIDMTFPLSVWLRDSGGRWHAARPHRRPRPGDREYAIRLPLMPPLTRPTDWIEVLASGQSGEVRARLPLRWRYPS